MKITKLRGTLVTVSVAVLAAGTLVAAVPAAAAPPQPTSLAQGIPEPDNDPFYRPADGYEAAEPGDILKQREVTVTGMKATQLQVRSTDAKDRPITIVSTVIVPPAPYPAGERPLLSYQPATDSLGDQCNPSYTLRTGTEKELPLLGMGLAQGWAVVVTDYQGPRDAYGPGRLEGHAVLDGVRAAKSLDGLSNSPVGLWGYSGGGLATGWAAELQPSYAPEVELAGVASGGTPADLRAAADVIDGSPYSGLLIGAVIGLTREYPELKELMNAEGEKLEQEAGDMCVGELAANYPFKRLRSYTTSPEPLDEPVAKEVLALNTMGSDAPRAPVYLYHSRFDQLIPHASAAKVAKQWCAQGTEVTFYTDYLSEHIALAISGAPAAVGYLGARFNGVSVPSTC
ncbi:MAG: lipase family protein [Thermocrispum sp.]